MFNNIAPLHFFMADGRPALESDADGFPRVAAGITDPADARLAAVALAIYSCGPHDEVSRAQIAAWVRQYKPASRQLGDKR